MDIRLGSIPFFKPAGLVTLAAKIVEIAATTGSSPLRGIADLSTDMQCYLARMNFFKTVGYEFEEPFQRWSPDRRFVPMASLVDARTYSDISESLSDMVCERCPVANQETRDAVYIALNELTSNIFDHSETPYPGVVCAQAYGLGQGMVGRIEVALADAGIGVRGSLLQGQDTRSKIEAGESPILLATSFGVTSKIVMHSGYGLFVAKELVRRNGGTFKVLSGKESVTFSKGGHTSRYNAVAWGGTIIAFTLLLDGPVDIRPVYDAMPERLEDR